MKVLLFDADGVLTLPEEVFMHVYAKSRSLDIEPFEKFYREQWSDIVTGKKDLKESIIDNSDLWQWDGTVDELVDYWCKTEDVRNEELLDLIRQLKNKGIPRYLATDQEKYRGEYMKTVMFPGLFEHYFISSTLGTTKTDPEYFRQIMEYLQINHPGLSSSDVIFFDDSQSKVDTAKDFGLDARLYVSIDQIKSMIES